MDDPLLMDEIRATMRSARPSTHLVLPAPVDSSNWPNTGKSGNGLRGASGKYQISVDHTAIGLKKARHLTAKLCRIDDAAALHLADKSLTPTPRQTVTPVGRAGGRAEC